MDATTSPSIKTKASYEAVTTVAEAMLAEGLLPSVRSVTARLGGGSPNTISTHLRKWKEEQPAVEARRAIVLDERIGLILAEQIQKAVTEARAKADAERDLATADLETVSQGGSKLEREAEESAAKIAALEQRAQHQAGVLETLQADLEKNKAEATDAISKAQAEAAAERAKIDSLSRELGAAQEQAKEADRLRLDFAGLNKEKQEEHAARMEAEKSLAVALAQAKDGTDRIKESATQVLQYAKRIEALEGEQEVLRVKLSDAQTAVAKAQAKVDDGIDRAKESAAQVQQHVKRMESLETEQQALRDKLSDAKTAAAKAQAQAEERATQITALKLQLAATPVVPSKPDSSILESDKANDSVFAMPGLDVSGRSQTAELKY